MHNNDLAVTWDTTSYTDFDVAYNDKEVMIVLEVTSTLNPGSNTLDTLPVDLRPPKTLVGCALIGSSSPVVARAYIRATGEVQISNPTSATYASGAGIITYFK